MQESLPRVRIVGFVAALFCAGFANPTQAQQSELPRLTSTKELSRRFTQFHWELEGDHWWKCQVINVSVQGDGEKGKEFWSNHTGGVGNVQANFDENNGKWYLVAEIEKVGNTQEFVLMVSYKLNAFVVEYHVLGAYGDFRQPGGSTNSASARAEAKPTKPRKPRRRRNRK